MTQRDDSGKFLPGTSGNPGGRPKNASAKLLRDAIDTALTPVRAAQIADTLIKRAVIGDWKAREQLFKLLGVNEPEQFDVNLPVNVATPDEWAATFAMVKARLEERKGYADGHDNGTAASE